MSLTCLTGFPSYFPDTSLIACLTKINRMDIVHLMETSTEPLPEHPSHSYAEMEQTIALDHSEGQAVCALCACVHVCVHPCVCICTCVHVYVCTHAHMSMFVCVPVRVLVCMRVCSCVRVCAFVYVCTCVCVCVAAPFAWISVTFGKSLTAVLSVTPVPTLWGVLPSQFTQVSAQVGPQGASQASLVAPHLCLASFPPAQ